MELHPRHDQEGTDSSQGKLAMSLTVHIFPDMFVYQAIDEWVFQHDKL